MGNTSIEGCYRIIETQIDNCRSYVHLSVAMFGLGKDRAIGEQLVRNYNVQNMQKKLATDSLLKNCAGNYLLINYLVPSKLVKTNLAQYRSFRN